MKLTPMLRQYFEAKEKQPDSLLFFRMGDFYELFFEDAEVAASELDITLTARGKADGDPIPMAGVPHHAAHGYIQRLVDKGHKVAICEQVEDASQVKGIVRRDVTRVVTPGVRLELEADAARDGNYLASVYPASGKAGGLGLALCDVSTGEVRVTEIESFDSLPHELGRASVRELVVPDTVNGALSAVALPAAVHVRQTDKKQFAKSALGRRLRELRAEYGDREFRSAVMTPTDVEALVDTVDGLGLRRAEAVRSALAGLLGYVAEVQLGIPSHLGAPEARRPADYVALDGATEANLEIFQALIGGGRAGSLLSVVDKTVSAIGARRLRAILAYPLVDPERINARLDAVEALVRGEARRATVRERLREVADIPRLTSRVVAGSGNARDLVALASSLRQIPELVALHVEDDPGALFSLLSTLDPCTELAELLATALVDEPPATTREGGMFRDGYDDDLDELIGLTRDGKSWLLEYERKQRNETGIDSLKLRYNKVFGYYLEVTRANLDKVPDDYIRKQTLANAERFFTLDLKEYEDKITGARDRRHRLESDLFQELVERVIETAPRLQQTAQKLADIDVLAALAELAVRNDYVRPEINDGTLTHIVDGRHPVVEKTAAGERFVPNSVLMDSTGVDAEAGQLLIVTGPNMAGKSTIIRQVALIQLLGQIGSFVPAAEAHLGVVDQIFSRVGAQDNLAQGQSTFMVEMTQTAHILRHATSRSLIILDEIGRGTSTFDGLAIAWAVAEHLTDVIGARAMFATHYHELTELVRTRDGARNVSVAVKEWNDEIVFLRRLVEGPANQSYGIQVGRLAGLPDVVVSRAKQVLSNLEATAYTSGGIPTLSVEGDAPTIPDSGQLDMFSSASVTPAQARVLVALDDVQPEAMTPLDALNLLHRLKGELES